ncbi:MAG: methyltransferase domain-containing protein [Elusimicrobiota bacterium]
MQTPKAFEPAAFTRESQQAWDKVAHHYDTLIADKLFNVLTKESLAAAALKDGEEILDVACGPGNLSLPAASAVSERGHVTGIDLAPAMIAIASAKAVATGTRNAVFQTMNAESMTLADESFDVVFCQLGLMLFAEPHKALKEMRRVLKRGGRAVVVVQGSPDKMLFTSLVQKTIVRHAPWMRVAGAPTIYSFGPQGVLIQAVSDAGFSSARERRLAGCFIFDSFDHYWDTLITGAGKTKSMLETLDEGLRRAIKGDVRTQAAKFAVDERLSIPYEAVMVTAGTSR